MIKLSDKTKYIIKGIIVFLIFEFSVYLQYIPVILLNINVKTMSYKTAVVLSTFSSIVTFFIFRIWRHFFELVL